MRLIARHWWRSIRDLGPRVRAEHGFTTIAVMGVMMVGGMLVAGAYAASDGDIKIARSDQDRKLAYAAAEAGVNEYLFHLNQDDDYWAKCTNVPPPNAQEASPINQAWDGANPATDPRQWRNIPGSASQYTIELLPATGYSRCDPSNAASMLRADGTFRIRATGRSNGLKRSIIASFRRKSFLDFLYYTKYETSDPVTYGTPDDIAYASSHCGVYRRDGRSNFCDDIQFISGDVVAGPFHTDDDIITCGTPTFGRSRSDKIEVSGSGYTPVCGNQRPNFVGSWATGVDTYTMPTTNATLKSLAGALYTGTTHVALSGASMTVTTSDGRTSTVPIPGNGVIYVQSGACGFSGYSIQQDYTTPAGCGDVYVHGTSSRSVTIAADNDVVVDGDLRQSGDALIGLIANNFVRVYHPVKSRSSDTPPNASCASVNPGTMQNVEIDAAILALNHSFIVDNYYCGGRLSTLTVKGAIAQMFRGPVGTTGGRGGDSGYTKAYSYDDRLRYRQPPDFLDPVRARWGLVRETEQLPPR